jgi:hypothetical protein
MKWLRRDKEPLYMDDKRLRAIAVVLVGALLWVLAWLLDFDSFVSDTLL